MKREEKIELLKQKLVEYFNKHGIDQNFTFLLRGTKASGYIEVFNYICNEIIKSKQAIFIFRLISNYLFYDCLDEDMKTRFISALIATKDAEYICKCLLHNHSFDKDTTEKLERTLVKIGSVKDIIYYIKNNGVFEDSFVDLIIKTKNPELIYNLAINYNQVDEDGKNMDNLIQALIETNNIELIKALADHFNNFIGNSQLNKKIYDYLNACLPFVQGADKAKLMNIRNEYEADDVETNEDSERIEEIIDTE